LRFIISLIVMAYVILGSFVGQLYAQTNESKPNILLIVGDDIGFGDLAISGSVVRTPNLDRLAQQGVTFTSFHSSPVCSVTRGMLLTGNNPIEIGLGAFDCALYPPAEGKPGYEAQSRFLDKFVRALNLKQMHIVGPDVGMPAALHYAIHRDHEAASLIIGDGPGILPTANGSIINKAVNSGFWRMMFKITGAGAFVDGGIRLALVNYSPSVEEIADYVASY
jgi:pimeloyl-ACP methyl ester carboxylesterase